MILKLFAVGVRIMTIKYKERLQGLLEELFQFDDADLDFGIYRIINLKRKEITKFITEYLPDCIMKCLSEFEDSKKLEEKQKRISDEIQKTLGCNVEEAKETNPNAPLVKEYLALELELSKSTNLSKLEDVFYNDIYNFFSRYYDEGDFISKKRYSKINKYVIPYNGDQVYFYWANKDQYYIKTNENFKLYQFMIDSLKVKFEIHDEEIEISKNNILDEKRFFILIDANYDQKGKTLVAKFGYRKLSKKEGEEILKIYNDTYRTNSTKVKSFSKGKIILDSYNLLKIREKTALWGIDELLMKKHILQNGELSTKSELEWHLNKYTTKNTYDYFIHKDLKSFLKHELDFYVKNELLHIEELAQLEDFKININRIKNFQKISNEIIEFLAQIENFQKKLWEKKKFVVSTDYLITLDYIDEKYYPKILENKEQLHEWNNLYSFDTSNLVNSKTKGKMVNYLDLDDKILLRQYPTMCIDTRFFDESFKMAILSEIPMLEEKITGILIKSENFQALNLLLNKYKSKIKCCYIDPPYNAKSSEILYKNTFKHSSWLSLMYNRLTLGKELLNDEFTQIVAIDEIEQEVLGQIINQIFPDNIKACISIVHNPRGQQGKNISYTHEFAYLIYPDDSKKYIADIKRDEIDSRNLRDSGTESDRTDAKNCFYPIIVKDMKIIDFGEIPSDDFHPAQPNIKRSDGTIEIWPINESGEEKKWRYALQSVGKIQNKLEIISGQNSLQVYFNKDTGTLKSLWTGARYDASEYGTKVLQNLFGKDVTEKFSYPKSIYNVIDFISATVPSNDRSIVIDYFAGSGTTGHAVIQLNKEDEGNRSFILIEMGEYFDTVLKPRMAKAIYSDNWDNGQPIDNKGSSHQIIKYQKLEQYEDTLINLAFKEIDSEFKETDNFQIKYMLEFESKDSETFLNLDSLDHPFNYSIKILEENEIKDIKIDLIETFNYLANIVVNSFYSLTNDSIPYVIVEGKSEEQIVFVIWRDKRDNFDLKVDKNFIENIILKDKIYDELYINGNSYVKNALLIDEKLKKLMLGL